MVQISRRKIVVEVFLEHSPHEVHRLIQRVHCEIRFKVGPKCVEHLVARAGEVGPGQQEGQKSEHTPTDARAGVRRWPTRTEIRPRSSTATFGANRRARLRPRSEAPAVRRNSRPASRSRRYVRIRLRPSPIGGRFVSVTTLRIAASVLGDRGATFGAAIPWPHTPLRAQVVSAHRFSERGGPQRRSGATGRCFRPTRRLPITHRAFGCKPTAGRWRVSSGALGGLARHSSHLVQGVRARRIQSPRRNAPMRPIWRRRTPGLSLQQGCTDRAGTLPRRSAFAESCTSHRSGARIDLCLAVRRPLESASSSRDCARAGSPYKSSYSAVSSRRSGSARSSGRAKCDSRQG